jgi:hypothetical protein
VVGQRVCPIIALEATTGGVAGYSSLRAGSLKCGLFINSKCKKS